MGLVVAAGGFVVVLVVAVVVWKPVEMTVKLSSGVLVCSFAESPAGPMTLAEMRTELALWYGKFIIANRAAIEERLKWFSWGLVGLAVETGGLTTMLMDVGIG